MIARRLLAAAALLVASAAFGQQELPTLEKGVQPDKVYHFHDLDTVNVYNGNLVIAIPVGLSYPLNSGVSYNLVLSYNSNVWDLGPGPAGTTHIFPTKRSNAGLGWIVGMGRFFAHYDTNNTSGSDIYETPDGGDHRFTNGANTTDGSAFRLRILSTDPQHPETETSVEVDSPDGSIRKFDRNSDGDFDLRRVHFTSTNEYLTFTRINTPSSQCPSDGYAWQIDDSEHRRHYLCFTDHDFDGVTRPMIDRVVVTGPQGGVASYVFHYQDDVRITKTAQDTDTNNPGWARYNYVPLLDKVTLPDTSTYEMTYNGFGMLSGLTLPTKGSIAYSYTARLIPSSNLCANNYGFAYGFGAEMFAVSRRDFSSASTFGNPQTETWLYSPSLTPSPPYVSVYDCTPPTPQDPNPAPTHPNLFDEMIVTITDPTGGYTQNHFSVWPGNDIGRTPDEDTSPAGYKRTNYGLPYGRYDSSSDLYLSQEAFSASGELFKSVWVRHDVDSWSGGNIPEVSRLISQRTVYPRDPANCVGEGSAPTCHWMQTAFSDWDTYAHYRVVTDTANFGNGGDSRTVTTSWNKSGGSQRLIFVTDNWIVNAYEDRTTQEGSQTAVEQACFDLSTGFLKAKRVLSGTSPQTSDVLARFTADATSGNLTSEAFFGGDRNPLPTEANTTTLCSALSSLTNVTPDYQIDHTWQNGRMATAKYSGDSFYSTDYTIDLSGLVSASRDSSGLETGFTYYSDGRLHTVSPPGLASTNYVFTPAAVSNGVLQPALLDEQTTTTGGGTVHKKYQFDSYGRLWREKQSMWDDSWSVRETLYDGKWRKTSVSHLEKLPAGGNEFSFVPSGKTTYAYDALDRVTSVSDTDGSLTQFTNPGASTTTRSAKIYTTQGEVSVDTVNTFDGLGRLHSVQEAAGTSKAVSTTYGYDVGGRLVSVTMSGDNATQSRTFVYDKRGFLNSETHPEVGINGNGTIRYRDYDARGHAWRKTTGADNGLLDLHFTFDNGERLTDVWDSGASMRALKHFVFPDTNDLSTTPIDRHAGKLSKAIRYNHLATTGDVVVTETYKYLNSVGKPSDRTTEIKSSDGTVLQSFAQSFTYDDLGLAQDLMYPKCDNAYPCSGSPPLASVPYTRTNGYLTAVSSYASSITYNADASLATVLHGTTSAITDTYTPDASAAPRPLRITFSGFQSCTPPTATVSGDGTIAPGGSVQIQAVLTGTAPWSLTWSDGYVQSGITSSPAVRPVSPSTTTRFTVTSINDASCAGTSSGSAMVTVSCTAPTATVSGGGSVLPGGSAQIQATLTGTAPWTLAWSDGVTESGIMSSPRVRTVTPLRSTTYWVTNINDANCAGTSSGNATVTVALAAPTGFMATTVQGNTLQVSLRWNAVQGAGWYRVERATVYNGTYTQIVDRLAAVAWSDSFTTVPSPVTYVYRVVAGATVGSVDTTSNPSAIDYATVANVLFSDEPLTGGVTRVRGVHISELRRAIDAVRAAAGLSPAWTSYAAATGNLSAADNTIARARLDEAVFLLTGYYVTYTGETPATNRYVRAYQLQQIRDGVR